MQLNYLSIMVAKKRPLIHARTQVVYSPLILRELFKDVF